jgi:hypothetical protein
MLLRAHMRGGMHRSFKIAVSADRSLDQSYLMTLCGSLNRVASILPIPLNICEILIPQLLVGS